MPRKKIKTEKQPLPFLLRAAGGARVHHNVPEVRAALNPKDFFTETPEHNKSTLNAWVSPQFDTSEAPHPVKRKRGKLCMNSLGNFTQLSRKNTVCSNRFPELSFITKSRDQQQRKKALNARISSTSNNQEFCRRGNTVCTVQKCGTTETGLLESDNINSHYGKIKKTTSQICGRSCISSESPLSHSSKDCTPADTASPVPYLVTAKLSDPSNPSNLLWPPPSSNSTGDILVPDTPERDYGVKVTWRRRRKLMLLLKAKGHLSDSDAIIHS